MCKGVGIILSSVRNKIIAVLENDIRNLEEKIKKLKYEIAFLNVQTCSDAEYQKSIIALNEKKLKKFNNELRLLQQKLKNELDNRKRFRGF